MVTNNYSFFCFSTALFLIALLSSKILYSDVSGADKTGCVGNLIWLDENGDGNKDKTEEGIYPVLVKLIDSDKKVVAQVTTNNGYYELCATVGRYQLSIHIPEGYEITKQNSGSDDYHDSDSNKQGFIEVDVVSNKNYGHHDFGLVPNRIQVDQQDQVIEHDYAEKKISFGPWVEYRHRTEVFSQFNTALLWAPPEEIIAILKDAKESNTAIILQLGSAADWGWDFENNISNFTLAKWFAAVDKFGENDEIRIAIAKAIDSQLIRSFYLIDEPHHMRWSPGGDDSNYISNIDIDQMAEHIKSYWPNASTSVRASPRALSSYGRGRPSWKFLDEAFVMINYRKWSQNGVVRTIRNYIDRELREARKQKIGVIGSVQMLIGAPSTSSWWSESDLGKPSPSGKLKVSPSELQSYFNHFTNPQHGFAFSNSSAQTKIDTVMVFRWDRNEEKDWQDPHYAKAISDLVRLSNQK